MTGRLGRLAAGAEVPVFLARGVGAGAAEAALRRSGRVRLVDSPRGATVLVAAGAVPASAAEAVGRVHDQLPHPRATVWVTGGGAADIRRAWPDATVVGPDGDLVAAVVGAHRDLLTGARASDPPVLPDVEPAEWRGVGPYGQGGTGMTGGVPYGRPLAGRAEDRDGLTLDVVPVAVGPFFWAFPAGLVLTVTFAGDVVHHAEVAAWASSDEDGLGAPLPDDATAPATLAGLELARARHHLRWTGRLLHLYGLDALARRVLVLAESVGPADAATVARLRRSLDRPWRLGRVTAGVGVVDGDVAAAWGGPVARAAGHAVDARTAAPAYAGLDFTPVTSAAGDVRARWRQRLAEAEQALDLAGRAGTRTVRPDEPVEPPAPPAPSDRAGLLAAAVTGAEWADAVATVLSLEPGEPVAVAVAP